MATAHLIHDKILEVIAAMSEEGLVTTKVLDGLVVGLNPRYAGMLPTDGPPFDRVLVTLGQLNSTSQLSDGSVPMVTWLKNAQMRFSEFPVVRNLISEALASVSARVAGLASGQQIKAKLPQRNERIVIQNDLLPFRFLQRGAEKGAAVARLTVTRCNNGAPALAGDGRPQRSIGTGWLLTHDLLITNHHVINARSAGEPDASATDLAAQALGIAVEFDFDAPEAAITTAKIGALEAFSPSAGPLDYAILRLASPVARTPLTVATTAMVIAPGQPASPSVNIIQHPEGRAKEVACRNNTVFRAEGVDLWYFTDTMAGSSGSPVFDDAWKVVALHKRWDFVRDVSYQGKDTAWANVGTQIFAILDDLGRTGKGALLAEILGDKTMS
jgi:V8-like Glu-specific endopeptidase